MQQMTMFEPAKNKVKPALNPDGVSVKGCSIIYAPKGQAGEYAPLSANLYRGCSHACVYCYVPKVLRMSRQEFDQAAIPRPDIINKLHKDAEKYQGAGITEQVMMSFTTDPYNPFDERLGLTRQAIKVLIDHGLGVCTLTKGGNRALRDIDLFRPSQDAFASTLTSLDDSISLKWESGAALPSERIETLKAFHQAGIFTWVSLEPVYDTNMTLEIIQQTHEFVDLFKIGRINYHRLTKLIDWEDFTHKAIDLFDKLEANHYVKKDLQTYLPKGYKNIKRIPQHN